MKILLNAPYDAAWWARTGHKHACKPALHPVQGFWPEVLIALGHDPRMTPVAACLTAGRDEQKDTRPALIASLVHWEAGHNDASITASGEALGISEDLARVWFYELAAFLSVSGFQCSPFLPYHCLIRLPKDAPVLEAWNVGVMRHESMMQAIRAWDPSLYWLRLMTELQMFMSQHPLNQQKNLPFSVNGLWFWGGGALQTEIPPLYTDSEILLQAMSTAQPMTACNFRDKRSVIVLEKNDWSCLEQYARTIGKREVNWVWEDGMYRCDARSWWARMISRNTTR